LRKSRATPFDASRKQREDQRKVPTVSQLITQRRNDVSKGWQSFLKTPLHSSIAEIIERKEAQLKVDFVPWAPAIAIASDYLLRTAGCNNSRRPPNWRKHRRWGYFQKGELVVRKRGEFWFVESAGGYVLVFRYGTMPVCTRTHQAAMRLAQHFFVRSQYIFVWLPLRPDGMRWVRSKPDGILSC
jgi:hypothetical protein